MTFIEQMSREEEYIKNNTILRTEASTFQRSFGLYMN
jgi:hypothetical protein